MIDPQHFAPRLLAWFDRHGRHDLPWQHPRTPYRVWLAEIMLQQTQVATVIPYYRRFVAALPDLPALAAADGDRVLGLWSGLGYYARARNLQRAAQQCVQQHDGELPRDLDALSALPGIGRSTAAAILAQAHGDRHAILDGNVKRVLSRLFAIEGWPGSGAVEKRLWPVSTALLPDVRLADYTQAIMDFGATMCTRAAPACGLCPFRDQCRARIDGRVDELPTPRPTRRLPTRDTVMTLLEDVQGRVLLQRRPPLGIWAGLWSLPEFADEQGAQDWVARHAPPTEVERLPSFVHTFSHYHLRVQPLRWRLGSVPPAAAIADGDTLRWSSIAERVELGLPAPVRRLLEPAD